MQEYTEHYIQSTDKPPYGTGVGKKIESRSAEYIIENFTSDSETAKSLIAKLFETPSYVKAFGAYEDNMLGFGFYDISYIKKDGITYKSNPHNHSKFIYFGQRISFEEANKIDWQNILECDYCKIGDKVFPLMFPGEMTYEEYANDYLKEKEREKTKKIGSIK